MAMWGILFVLAVFVFFVYLGRRLNPYRNRIPFLTKDVTGAHCPILQDAVLFGSAIQKGFLWHASHRGSSIYGPENTLDGFKKCLDVPISTQLLEFDVRLTKDKILILLHDATLDRTTNAKGYVSSYNIEDISYIDAAHYYSEDGKSFPLRGKGINIPRLTDLLDMIKKDHPYTKLMFDIKDLSAVEPVLKLITKYQIENRVILGAVEERINQKIKKHKAKEIPLCSGWKLFFLIPLLHFFGLLWLYPINQEIYLGIGRLTSRQLVEAMHARGIRVAVFQPFITWDSAEWHNKCIELDIDFVITDKPELLRDALSNKHKLT